MRNKVFSFLLLFAPAIALSGGGGVISPASVAVRFMGASPNHILLDREDYKAVKGLTDKEFEPFKASFGNFDLEVISVTSEGSSIILTFEDGSRFEVAIISDDL